MSLIKYRAFIKVVERKSITRTAEAMGYLQFGISNMLNALEDEVGFPCLIWKGRYASAHTTASSCICCQK